MNTNHHKFLIALASIIIISGVFVYFTNNLDVNAAATDSPLASSQNNPDITGNVSSDQLSQDTAFLYTLASLKKIKIDRSLFDDSAFNALTDNTVVLEPSTPGRPNPFAPINMGNSFADAKVLPVITNTPAQITTKSAVLNGTTNNVNGVSSAYFEYGPTEALGKVTPQAKQSLIGSFGANITGLNPGSVYFFRAVAKINGVLNYGEIISFNTN